MRILKVAFILLLVFSITSKVSAQIALAVAKNDNGSSVKYSLKTGATLEEAYTNAKKALEEEEMQNIYLLRSSENTGHELKSGHFVLIIASRKNGGRFFISYGLGISEKSKAEAVERAITHLKEWDLGFDKSRHSYSIEKEGLIKDLFPTEEEEEDKK